MTVAVTGAGGFVGRHLVKRLSEAGYCVRGLYHRRAGGTAEGVQAVWGGLEDSAALDRLIDGSDAVVHLAGLVAADRQARFHAVNAAGTAQLAQRAAAHGVDRFLFVSSLAARHPGLSSYAASKRGGERALARQDGLPADILRPPAVYGAGDPQILTFIRLIRRGLAPLPGPPEARVCVVHVDDLVAAITAWLAGPGPTGTTYEISDDRPDGYSWRELMATAAAACNARPVYLRLGRSALMPVAAVGEGIARLTGRPATLSRGKVRELCHPDWRCDPTPFHRATGWRPRVGASAGLRHTVAWYYARGWL